MILIHDQLKEQSELHIEMEDRGYQFGDGIYEVIRVYGGRFFELEGHLERLKRSANELGMELPYSTNVLRERLEELIAANHITDGQVYMQVTRGVAERTHHFPDDPNGVLIAYTKDAARPMDKLKNGIKVITTEDIRWLRCDIKSLNLLGNVLCKQKAKDAACEEAVLLRGDVVTEGSSSNVFIVQKGEVWTHPANNFILNGITRNVLMDLAEKCGIKVNEIAFTKKELMEAEEVFITSTTMEVSPVVQIDGRLVGNGKPGVLTKRLQANFNEKISTRQNV